MTGTCDYPREKFDGENRASAFHRLSGIIYLKTVKTQERKLWTPAAPTMLRIIQPNGKWTSSERAIKPCQKHG